MEKIDFDSVCENCEYVIFLGDDHNRGQVECELNWICPFLED
jgi:hypothetical protein